MLDDMRQAWKGAIDLRPRLKRMDFKPSLGKIAQPTDAVVRVKMEVWVLGSHMTSMIDFCAPCAIIKPVLDTPSTRE